MDRPVFVTTILLLIPHAALALSCFVCATGNLDEFGECSSQFQYDCSGYALKAGRGERIYCRTTRERQRNGTFTVMKECISESDHYRKFPNKGYPLDEECDLVDVDGEEVAYCVCRHAMCNRNPIAEQFMAFEEKHPELFADSSSEQPSVPSGPAPLSIPSFGPSQSQPSPPAAFAAPQFTPPAIVPVNDPRFSVGQAPSSEREVRRQQLPVRPREDFDSVPDTTGLRSRDDSVSTGAFALPPAPSVSQSGFVGTVGKDPVAVQRPAQPVNKNMLHCMQCGEKGLRDENSDCAKPISVQCDVDDGVCFTRFIVVAPGQHQVEKMCVSEAVVKSMFGESGNHCGSSSQDKEQYCTCSTDQCNRISIAEQRALLSPPPLPEIPTVPPFVAARLHPTPPGPQLAAPELPVATPEEIMAAAAMREEEEQLMKNLPPSRDLLPPLPAKEEPALQPIVPAIVNKPSKPLPRCSTCSQSDMTDPTADCSVSAETDCPGMDERRAMCITKQTQIGKVFMMEKRCVNRGEFAAMMPEEKFEEGCATSDEGMINYCLCRGSKCNKESLLQQAQNNGVRETSNRGPLAPKMEEEPEQQPQPVPPAVKENQPKQELPKVPAMPREQRPPAVFMDEDGAAAPPDSNKINDIGLTSEEQDLLERRRQWAEADLTAAATPLSVVISSLLLVFVGWM